MNTGFGGSADSRTTDLHALQRSLLQHTQSGILIDLDRSTAPMINDELAYHSQPAAWVRATMLVRWNSTVRGHSAVRSELVEAILQLLCKGLTPIIPLRGTISASGDLMPLSYIAGALEGCPDVWVRVNDEAGIKVTPAPEALRMARLKPIVLDLKEGLGMTNGIAASAAVGALSIHDANQLTIFAQVLVAMSCEALVGNSESFHPFIAQVRPHVGQVEAAGNIAHFLKGSRLAAGVTIPKDPSRGGLFQDRYGLCTSSQWIGPQLEDLLLSVSQVVTELHSTADNPLVDVDAADVYSGGNFSAAAVTSATEKTRSALQMIGKLLFSLCTEMINPSLNRGLPTNLAADDQSLSFTMKGVDVNMAAYMSELATLLVQSARMSSRQKCCIHLSSIYHASCRAHVDDVRSSSVRCLSGPGIKGDASGLLAGAGDGDNPDWRRELREIALCAGTGHPSQRTVQTHS